MENGGKEKKDQIGSFCTIFFLIEKKEHEIFSPVFYEHFSIIVIPVPGFQLDNGLGF